MITYHPEVIQGSDEWLAMRCGLLTASEVPLIITPTLKIADNDKSRAHLFQLAAQRITSFVEPHYVGDDMLRGWDDEILARALYSEHYAPVTECGFVTNDGLGFKLGCSPDGLVGDDGMIEVKSRRYKFQIETIVNNVPAQTIPADYAIQIQTSLLVTRRSWCDFISYSGGLPMVTIRAFPDAVIQGVIIEATTAFEARIQARMIEYENVLKSDARLIATERRAEVDIGASDE